MSNSNSNVSQVLFDLSFINPSVEMKQQDQHINVSPDQNNNQHHKHKHGKKNNHHHHHHHRHNHQNPKEKKQKAGPVNCDCIVVTTPMTGVETIPALWTSCSYIIELLDSKNYKDAKKQLHYGLVEDPRFIPFLLLARFLRINHSELFSIDEPTAEELCQKIEESPQEEKAEAVRYRKVIEKETESPISMFLAALIWDKVCHEYEQAFKWYMNSALLDCKEAQFAVGYMYSRGTGVPMSQMKAVKWYKKAAEAGKASAQNNLGLLYLTGSGVIRNKRKGVKLIQMAAEQGSETASTNLERLTSHGIMTKQSRVFSASTKGFVLQQDVVGASNADDPDVTTITALNGTGKKVHNHNHH